jgi:hypothetical protein
MAKLSNPAHPRSLHTPPADGMRPVPALAHSRLLWLVPLLLSAAFVIVMMALLTKSDADEP